MIDLRYVKKLIDILDESTVDSIEISSDKGMKIRISKSPQQRGLGDLFGHSLGHGVGLEVHEAPRLARTADAPLPVGSVVTIEPGVYRPGWGGIRIEDDVHLGADGPRILTRFTRELLEVA